MNTLEKYLADRSIRNRNALLLENKKLIYHVCKEFKIPQSEIPDAFNAGVIGMSEGIDRFESDKGGFSSWIYLQIKAKIKEYVTSDARGTYGRPGRKRGSEHNLRVYGEEDAAAQTAADTPNPADVITDKELLAKLKNIPLSPMEMQIVVHNMAGDKDLRQLSREGNRPYMHYYRARTHLQERLRKALSR